MGKIKRWDKTSNSQVEVPCPSIIQAYKKNMVVVDLVDILIALCRIKVRTKRWYIKIFWHLIDICKVNSWNLYRRHCIQCGKPKRQVLSLLLFSVDLGNAVIHANKPVLKKLGRPTKRSSAGNIETGKSKRAVIPCKKSGMTS